MENNRLIRCIVVDDEHPAIRLLSGYIKKTPGLELVLQTTHPHEALEAIRKHSIDLVFLDIQMPEMTGIELMKAIENNNTKVILTTAYSQYALEGFTYDVVDYLLKPITFERFLIAITKAKRRMAHLATECSGHLLVKMEYRVHKTEFSTIQYIKGLGDYIVFYTTNGKLMTLERLKNMEKVLPTACFIRIHKSFIVNIAYIEYIEKSKVFLVNEQLPIGDSYRNVVEQKLGV